MYISFINYLYAELQYQIDQLNISIHILSNFHSILSLKKQNNIVFHPTTTKIALYLNYETYLLAKLPSALILFLF